MNREAFYAALRRRESGVFGTSLSQRQVVGIEGILLAFATHGDGRAKTLAYALATAYHETGRRMVPVREGFAENDAQARQRVNRLAAQRGPNSAVAKYAKPQPPYGHVYYGRGQVQLTWKKNYETSSADAGTDLVQFPDEVLDPEIGARILVRGLMDGRWNGHGHGIAQYLPDSGDDDLRNARRTVNITDKWKQIADYYLAFRKAIEEAGGVPKLDVETTLAVAIEEEIKLSPPLDVRTSPEGGQRFDSEPPAHTDEKKPSTSGKTSPVGALVAAAVIAVGGAAAWFWDTLKSIGGSIWPF